MDTVAHSIASQLFLYGPLGIICVILLMAVVYLQRRNEKQEERHRAELVEQQKQMAILVDRHITKAETWAAKGNELADRQTAVLESIVKRRRE